MERFEKRTEVLNDLLNINKDCSAAYRSFISETRTRPEAHGVVVQLEGVCRDCITELHMRIDPTLGDPADAVDLKGIVYRSWAENDEVYFARQTPGVFASCEQKISGIKKAYEHALQTCGDITGDVRELLNNQLRKVVAAFDLVNEYKKKISVSSSWA